MLQHVHSHQPCHIYAHIVETTCACTKSSHKSSQHYRQLIDSAIMPLTSSHPKSMIPSLATFQLMIYLLQNI